MLSTGLLPNLVTLSGAPEVMSVRTLQQRAEVGSNGISMMKCAQVLELPGAYLCASNSQQQMNKTFTRMGIFWGSGKDFPPGTFLSNENSVLKRLEETIAGHNLPGGVISNYFVAADHQSPADCLNVEERGFEKGFIESPEISALAGRYYLIAFSANSVLDYRVVVNHEIHHAQYYLHPELKAAINDFWKNQVTEEDKGVIREMLGTVYNEQNEDLMIDEFQAYILQEDAEHAMLAHFVESYRARLIAQLTVSMNYRNIPIR